MKKMNFLVRQYDRQFLCSVAFSSGILEFLEKNILFGLCKHMCDSKFMSAPLSPPNTKTKLWLIRYRSIYPGCMRITMKRSDQSAGWGSSYSSNPVLG